MVAEYDYHLPPELIAHSPAEPRDTARLLVYKMATDEIVEDTFANLAKYLPPKSLLVLNDTRVAPARLELFKKTGGSVRILFLLNEWNGGELVKGLPDRKLKLGDVLLRNDSLKKMEPFVEVVSQINEEFTFKILDLAGFGAVLDKIGQTPLPPYIHSSLSEKEVREKYQTVFANVSLASTAASVAAPTASLHFTKGVFESLEQKGIEKTYVTLHVGRGTFSPVSATAIESGKLHSEPICLSSESASHIKHAKEKGRPVIAAGTTATRVLESAADFIESSSANHQGAFSGETSIFIRPPYHFKMVDGLITNFHLPKTSLLMLLDAFLKDRGAKRSWRDLYDFAIVHKYRFFSFGDAMLII